jgi:hypothetical protein
MKNSKTVGVPAIPIIMLYSYQLLGLANSLLHQNYVSQFLLHVQPMTVSQISLETNEETTLEVNTSI